MKTLFVSINDPFGVGGGDFATHAYLLAFSKLCNGDVDVFVREGVNPDGNIDANYFFVSERNWLARTISLFRGELHRNVNAIIKRLSDISDYDYCVFNSSRVSAGLIEKVRSLGIKTITIHHNVEKEIVLGNTPNPIRRAIFANIVDKVEKRAYLKSDYNLFLTQQDCNTFHRLYGRSNSVEGVIGTFEYKPIPPLCKKEYDTNFLTFAITGSLNQYQGIDGIKFFFDELYQHLPKESKVIISGRNPTQEVVSLCDKHENVQLIPNPDDMNTIINMADVYICPTRLGGGLKLRVMDGLRLGIPVITHSCSARGYNRLIDSGCVSVFDNSEQFANELLALIKKMKAGNIQRSIIRQHYESVFSFGAGFRRIKAILDKEHNN